jgi:hypothetical protein
MGTIAELFADIAVTVICGGFVTFIGCIAVLPFTHGANIELDSTKNQQDYGDDSVPTELQRYWKQQWAQDPYKAPEVIGYKAPQPAPRPVVLPSGEFGYQYISGEDLQYAFMAELRRSGEQWPVTAD